jgi:GTPase
LFCVGPWDNPAADGRQRNRFGLKKIRRSQLRKGQVIVEAGNVPSAVKRFEAQVLVLYHNTTIQPRYQVGLAEEGGRNGRR